MNGRVYDPLTAQFFSPDPYVQAPGDWLNYNRYSYCLGNPFKYTDPSGNLFWVFPSISWSPSGGFSIGITVGFGIPYVASISANASYNFKNASFSFSATASACGFYTTGGYNTKGGWFGGSGYNASEGLNIAGFHISTNMTNIGLNYSGRGGGLSSNFFGFQVNENGLLFDPSITVGYQINIGETQTQKVTQADQNKELMKKILADLNASVEIDRPELARYNNPTPEIPELRPMEILKEVAMEGGSVTKGVHNISDAGLQFIASYEGFSSTIYKDVAGFSTIGYGHLVNNGESFSTLSKGQALQLLKKDASFAVKSINKNVRVPLNQNKFDALSSFIYNVGTGAFEKSSLLRNINSGNNGLINKSFMLYNKATINGILSPVQGLTNRRQAEVNLFFK